MLTFLYMYHHSLLLKSEAIETYRAAQDVAWGHRTGGSAAWTHQPLGPATSFKITVGFLIVSLDSELYLCCSISSWSFKNSSPLKVLGFLVFCFKRNSSHASSKISSSFWNHLATPFSMLQPLPPIMATKCKAICHKLDAKVENHPHQSIIPQKKTKKKHGKKTSSNPFRGHGPWFSEFLFHVFFNHPGPPTMPPTHSPVWTPTRQPGGGTEQPPQWFIDQLHRKSQHFFQVKWCLNFSRF